jgi:hypothetical protein
VTGSGECREAIILVVNITSPKYFKNEVATNGMGNYTKFYANPSTV